MFIQDIEKRSIDVRVLKDGSVKGVHVLKLEPITIDAEFTKVEHFNNRTPETTQDESRNAFASLSGYRDGAIFIADYAGSSEWERHLQGDEFIHVLSGETRLILLVDNEEHIREMREGQLFVVPKGIWHRFESPNGVKILTITPQPTDHQIERPTCD